MNMRALVARSRGKLLTFFWSFSMQRTESGIQSESRGESRGGTLLQGSSRRRA